MPQYSIRDSSLPKRQIGEGQYRRQCIEDNHQHHTDAQQSGRQLRLFQSLSRAEIRDLCENEHPQRHLTESLYGFSLHLYVRNPMESQVHQEPSNRKHHRSGDNDLLSSL